MKYQFRIFMDFEFMHSCIHTSTVVVDYSCHCTFLIAPCCVSFLVTFGLDQKKALVSNQTKPPLKTNSEGNSKDSELIYLPHWHMLTLQRGLLFK